MMADLKKRGNFARVVNYVNNPKKAKLIDSKDVRLDDNSTIARSMQGQADDKQGRKLSNPVYHISLNFAHEDTAKLTDELMVEIAREYMQRMGITNTQYIICRHIDREHQHLHIVANRVDNDGKSISDSNDDIRSIKICKALTKEYGLHISKGKMNVKRDRLRGKDKVKYQIYDAIKAALPHCRSWAELSDRLSKDGIKVYFKFNRAKGEIIGVSFRKDELSFSGSRVDRSMSYYAIDRQLGGHITNGIKWESGSYDNRTPLINEAARCKASYLQSATQEADYTNSQTGATDYSRLSDNDTTTNADAGSAIVSVAVDAFIELYVQPHLSMTSSGGGGASSNNSDDREKDKDKQRPFRRRR